MIRGLYSAASGMASTMMDMDILANNLSNMNTTGFKKSTSNYQAFKDVLINRIDKQGSEKIGSYASGVQLAGTHVQHNQGTLKRTNNPFDLALQGTGFFKLEGPNGQTLYTRNGSFTRSANGFIVNQDGMRVLGQNNGPIQIPENVSQITITNGGLVANGEQVLGQIGIEEFSNPESLEQQGQYLFSEGPGTRRETFSEDKTTVVQGSLELANVNAVEELVRNISGVRRYESIQRSIRMQNESLKLAVTQVGRYR